MNVDIGAEAAQFPEKEYISGIAVAVYNTWPSLWVVRQTTYIALKCIEMVCRWQCA
jgi:hypothetical protein